MHYNIMKYYNLYIIYNIKQTLYNRQKKPISVFNHFKSHFISFNKLSHIKITVANYFAQPSFIKKCIHIKY